ncbi:MAG: LysR family transcriptional regulator [Moraxellaceae bacterium]|nr:LysR family transcriptional regulator [Moraxellaceae bacterium]MDZ4387572.1 LysR family transcriptional regulator [Moraxellaceae bacterium]
MHDLNDLYFFVQVVDHGGFAAAGRALGQPKSKLSRRISQLEDRLGVRLLQRSTRHFSVTEMGQAFYQECVAMLVQADSAFELVERHRSEPQGVIRLSCPNTLLNYRVGPLLSRFMVKYPRVQIHLEATNRRVDVIAEGFDIALRVRFPPLEDSDLVMRVLVESPQRLVASPELLASYPSELNPADLSRLPSMSWGVANDYAWCMEGPDGAQEQVSYRPRFVTEEMTALRQAALAGVGVVQLPLMVVDKDLAEGRLVNICPDWVPRSGIVHAVFPSRRGVLPSVRALIDFLAENIWE